MRDLERIALAAAGQAGDLLRERFGTRHEVTYKGAVDLVTAVDRAAEALVVATIRDAFPDHGIVAEESAPIPGREAYRWYVDPLDGTTNFAHGYPHVSVSIAVARGDALLVGVVHDPLRRETFRARAGDGAWLGETRISVSETDDLGASLLATGFPYDRRTHAATYLRIVEEALRSARCVRRGGSAALDLSYVAAGRLDGFWEPKLKPWDTAAGRLLVVEAGGEVSSYSGGPHQLEGDEIAASNGHIHSRLLAIIAAGGRPD